MLYKYRIDGEMEVPDPASHFQPQDVFGPSEIIDHKRFEWRTHQWRGRPWQDAAVFALYVATFPPGRTVPPAVAKTHHAALAPVIPAPIMSLSPLFPRRNWRHARVPSHSPH